MAPKSVHKSVEDAFDQKTREEFGQKYLELIYANWSETVRTLRRTVLLSLLLAMSFLLLGHANDAELTLGPLRISNIAAVLTLIPAATSFLFFEAIDLSIADNYYKEAASATVKTLYRSVYDNDLELLLEPATGFAWGAGSTTSLKPDRPGRTGTLLGWADFLVVMGIVLSVLGFLVYAYMHLYGSGHTSFVAVSLSLVFCLFNLARATLELVAASPYL